LPILEEVKRRTESPFFTFVPRHRKDRNQLRFMRMQHPIRILTGGNGSGKSRTAFQDIGWKLADCHPWRPRKHKRVIWVIAPSWQNLYTGVYTHFEAFFPKWMIAEEGPPVEEKKYPMARWHKMTNGHEVWWFTAEGGNARKKFQSAEVSDIYIDEEIGEGVFEELLMRQRKHGVDLTFSATMVESEPWMVELEDHALEGNENYGIVRLSSKAAAEEGDISSDWLKVALAKLSPDEQEVRIYGHSRKSQGLIYSDLDPMTHVVNPRPIPYDADVTRYCGIDTGHNTTAVLWFAAHPNGLVELYRELYLNKTTILEVAGRMLRMEGWVRENEKWKPSATAEYIRRRYVDPSAFYKQPDGSQGAAIKLMKYGVRPLIRGNNDVDLGIDECHELLLLSRDNVPRFVVHRTCENFLKERGKYRYKRPSASGETHNIKPHKSFDHAMDAWRYAAMGGFRYEQTTVEDRVAMLSDRAELREGPKYYGGTVSERAQWLVDDFLSGRKKHRTEQEHTPF
jgi:hypothetical protein